MDFVVLRRFRLEDLQGNGIAPFIFPERFDCLDNFRENILYMRIKMEVVPLPPVSSPTPIAIRTLKARPPRPIFNMAALLFRHAGKPQTTTIGVRKNPTTGINARSANLKDSRLVFCSETAMRILFKKIKHYQFQASANATGKNIDAIKLTAIIRYQALSKCPITIIGVLDQKKVKSLLGMAVQMAPLLPTPEGCHQPVMHGGAGLNYILIKSFTNAENTTYPAFFAYPTHRKHIANQSLPIQSMDTNKKALC